MEQAVSVLEPGAPDAVWGRHLARQAEPYVRAVREEVFGSADPPFGSAEEAAEFDAGRLKRRLGGNTTATDGTLSAAVTEIAGATGFDAAEVLAWVYTDARPHFRRVVLRWGDQKRDLGDGTTIRRRTASLLLNGPVEESEFRRAWRRIRRVWDGPDPRHRREKIDTADADLDELVDRMPLGEYTWRQRLKEWNRTAEPGRHDPVTTTAALGMRWQRLNAKKRAIEPDPKGEDNA